MYLYNFNIKSKGDTMKISYHAGQRFIERVIKKVDFTKYEVHRTVEYLERVFQNVVLNTYSKAIPLPGFENQFYVVCMQRKHSNYNHS